MERQINTNFFDQFSLDAIREQYAKNAKQLRMMADKANSSKTGKYNGKDAAFWLKKSDEYANMSK